MTDVLPPIPATRRRGGSGCPSAPGSPSAPGVPGAPGSPGAPETETTLVAFVANPTKRASASLHAAAIAQCQTRGLPAPLWFATTAEDPGVGQAQRALDLGATVVVAVGGDGTARAVAQALLGTRVPMGVIPLGTGNLLARNLGLPLTSTDHALRLALTGRERAIDVGWLRVEDDPRENLFLVMAGLGFDAALLGGADARLKARFGWAAYFISGARQWNARRLRAEIDVDGGAVISQRVRTLVIGNCGRLQGGLTLLPRARPDDGWLDVGAVGTRGGIQGWLELIHRVVLQSTGVRRRPRRAAGNAPIGHVRARRVRVRTDRPEAIQADGELLGRAQEVTARVDPGALLVLVA
ncbi:diacylglycerol/lipid kinase family protein [Pengzhenrongella sicca]|uniref:NAD(+)/NADH kinase n=1 Tax=Pengzhenrongella sicca TaxID=2819238 RepID=A0A8A4ZC65_9MICO|nr:diacylglycerol kinase family protein [Pengzhenrongella sicca]QTE28186.1 NAD(+)/NADH kinase [Pengzhenrongella sicca]